MQTHTNPNIHSQTHCIVTHIHTRQNFKIKLKLNSIYETPTLFIYLSELYIIYKKHNFVVVLFNIKTDLAVVNLPK